MPPRHPPNQDDPLLSTTGQQHLHVVTGPNLWKPPLPTARSSLRNPQQSRIETQIPPLISGAITAAFSSGVCNALDNVLLAHYYLPENSKVRVNLDRVLDRLIAEFTGDLWDELWDFYHDDARRGEGEGWKTQIRKLFDGPVRQVVLVLNGPETSSCLLDRLAPGLSRRKASWTAQSGGIDLSLSLQLLCTYWHREFTAQSPGGSPDEIARTLVRFLSGGRATSRLLENIRTHVVRADRVQMHVLESATWDITMRKPWPPAIDGYHLVQLGFECDLSGTVQALQRLGSVPVVVGDANEYITTTVQEYANTVWPNHGPVVLKCLEEAIDSAGQSRQDGATFAGLSIWDGNTEHDQMVQAPGLRMLYMEIEEGILRVTVTALTNTLMGVLQQLSWMAAATGASPFPGPAEVSPEVTGWNYDDGTIYISCGLVHQPVPASTSSASLHHGPATKITTGFPTYMI